MRALHCLVLSLALGVNAWQAAKPLRLPSVSTSVVSRNSVLPVMDFGFQRPIKEDAAPGEVADVPFEVRFSIGNLVTGSGAALFVYCLGTYLINNGQVSSTATNHPNPPLRVITPLPVASDGSPEHFGIRVRHPRARWWARPQVCRATTRASQNESCRRGNAREEGNDHPGEKGKCDLQ